ncbi:MAG: cell surface protein SprA [Bacteroidales bacterium]
MILLFLWALGLSSEAHINFLVQQTPDSLALQDTIELPFNFEDEEAYPYMEDEEESPLFLDNPENVKSSYEYDPENDEYILRKKIGEFDYRPPAHLGREEYWDIRFEQMLRDFWRQKASGAEATGDEGLLPQLKLGGETFSRIFGSNTIDIVPQGSAELIFGVNINNVEDPKLSEKLRRNTTFDFEEKIQMNVTGSIGDKIQLGINYDTEATFDFENQTKLEYSGGEDEILQDIEAGNVSMPLPGSLITGSQSLFGLKTRMRFGNLEMTTVFSQQKGQSKVIQVRGGAQTRDFEIDADEYDQNRHFFLSHYFRENYNKALNKLPVIQSNIDITRVEVWITNKRSNFENSRNIIALMDLGEGQINGNTDHIFASDQLINVINEQPSDNQANNLYQKLNSAAMQGIRDINNTASILQQWDQYDFRSGQDYVKLENARKLDPNEYTVNEKLGYISLKSQLRNDEVLAVAFEYIKGGEKYQVGEFSNEGITAPNALMVKLLKGTAFTPKFPTWKLMMKNIYSIDAYQVNKEGFELNVLYQDDKTGNEINYLPEGKVRDQMLLRLLNLDNVNSQNDANPDGMFDFIPGITINQSEGKIIFPVVEPFGAYLRKQIGNNSVAEKYVFEELYDSTLTIARQTAEKNKFKIRGEYQSSSSSEIPLNAMNIPEGSVIVTAGGRKLIENVDYTVDYNLGRVNILNQGLMESGTPIQISLENQATYSMQKKTLIGSHFNYNVSENFNLGATVMNLTERPLTRKVNIGNEPISNTIWGLNGSYRSESPFLTQLVDGIPFLDTEEQSSIRFDGEFAHLIPGHSQAIEKEGVSYIDDFEGSETAIDMKNPSAWVLASTPQGQPELFPEASLIDSLPYNYNRSRLAWYHIDPLFLRENSPNMPQHLKSNPDQRSSHFVREIYEKELFPNKDNPNDIPASIQVLNLAFFPDERGPYNYEHEPSGEGGISAGIQSDGSLKEPESRWGGIMREINTTDFEESNVEYIEFWLMDPFVYDSTRTNEGTLYFNLGTVSEDILKDGRKSFENGLPTSEQISMVDTTSWGRIPISQSLVNAFDNDPEARKFQDVGLDGISDEEEQTFFSEYLDNLNENLSDEAFDKFLEDPSNDNYHYYRGSDYNSEKKGIIERYKKYNGMEGNSPTSEQSPENYPTSGKTLPDVEDINQDNTLEENENYYQYRVELDPREMQVGENYITDKVKRQVELANGNKSEITWYQFKIPVRKPDKRVGAIRDFKSIRFMRMFLREFQDSVILRFAKLNLVRGEWRNYTKSLYEAGENLSAPEFSRGSMNISTVNIEENANKTPVNYVLPPGIDRVIDPTNPQLRQLNEQAIAFNVQELEDGDARAAFKNIDMDVRQFKKLRMFLHTEALENKILNDNDLRAFIRLGTDYRNNYYEYEIPLDVTPPGFYNNTSGSDRKQVWKNEMVINLNELPELKLERNNAMRKGNTNISMNTIYSMIRDGAKISVRGNPNLSNLKTIMMGIRNPDQQGNTLSEDDGMPKSGEVWINELRLSDFKEEGGWAARGRMSTQLADFGRINVSGNTSTPGFGSIDKKVNERNKEKTTQYDLSTNLDLGKFFPDKAGVRIPMYLGYSERFITPQYNPLNPDIQLEDALDAAEDQRARDSLKKMSQDYVRRKSINFNNVRVTPQNQNNPAFYDISNFSMNYSYNEIFARDINTDYNLMEEFQGGLVYNFNTNPQAVTPFQGIGGIFNTDLFRILRDFNFYYYPSSITVSTNLRRSYNAIRHKSIANPNVRYQPTFDKNFLWNRHFNIQFDLTRSLKLNFDATNRARIDEPRGMVNKRKEPIQYQFWKDSVMSNIRNFGRNTDYNHKWEANYRVPINKLPLLDWVNVSARFNGTYNWQAGPLLHDTSSINLGNTIRNSNTLQLNSQFNFNNLYNKVGFLKKINQQSRGRNQTQYETVNYNEDNVSFEAGEPERINHNLMTENIQVEVFDNQGRRIDGSHEILNKRAITFETSEDYQDAKVEIQGKIEQTEGPFQFIAENLARILMGVKNISISYSQSEGSELPGFLPNHQFLGLNQLNNHHAPTIPFILGWQNENFANLAKQNNWITRDPNLSSPFTLTNNKNLNLRASIEPFQGIRIDLNGSRSESNSQREYYTADSTGTIRNYGLREQGNFSMSFLSIGTAFDEISQENNYHSDAFDKLRSNRKKISQRLAERRREQSEGGYDPSTSDNQGYWDGYGPTSQHVLIPAFLSAYGEYGINNAPLDKFPMIPFPNWRINFNNLSNVSFIKEVAQSVNISHSYKSTYTIGNFLLNPDYTSLEDNLSHLRDVKNNFIPKYEINSVAINEQFNPLINFDVTWQNNLTTSFQISKSRRVSLSFANNQVTETLSDQYSFSVGYRFENFNLILDFGGQREAFQNDLNIKGNVKLRDNLTILRKLDEDVDDMPTAGQRNVVIGFSSDYALSNRLNVRVFFDRNVNEPKISRSYPTSNTNFGFSLRFTLAE